MVKSSKGITLIELLAIVVIASIIITPLMFSMTQQVSFSHSFHRRRSAVTIADGALYGFDKITYLDLETIQEGETDHITDFDSTTCPLLPNPDDQAFCTALFNSTFNGIDFDSTHFKVYIYDYNISAADKTDLLANASLPQEVVDEITAIDASSDPNPGLLRITVWIEYDDDEDQSVVLSGLLIGDWTSAFYE